MRNISKITKRILLGTSLLLSSSSEIYASIATSSDEKQLAVTMRRAGKTVDDINAEIRRRRLLSSGGSQELLKQVDELSKRVSDLSIQEKQIEERIKEKGSLPVGVAQRAADTAELKELNKGVQELDNLLGRLKGEDQAEIIRGLKAKLLQDIQKVETRLKEPAALPLPHLPPPLSLPSQASSSTPSEPSRGGPPPPKAPSVGPGAPAMKSPAQIRAEALTALEKLFDDKKNDFKKDAEKKQHLPAGRIHQWVLIYGEFMDAFKEFLKAHPDAATDPVKLRASFTTMFSRLNTGTDFNSLDMPAKGASAKDLEERKRFLEVFIEKYEKRTEDLENFIHSGGNPFELKGPTLTVANVIMPRTQTATSSSDAPKKPETTPKEQSTVAAAVLSVIPEILGNVVGDEAHLWNLPNNTAAKTIWAKVNEEAKSKLVTTFQDNISDVMKMASVHKELETLGKTHGNIPPSKFNSEESRAFRERILAPYLELRFVAELLTTYREGIGSGEDEAIASKVTEIKALDERSKKLIATDPERNANKIRQYSERISALTEEKNELERKKLELNTDVVDEMLKLVIGDLRNLGAGKLPKFVEDSLSAGILRTVYEPKKVEGSGKGPAQEAASSVPEESPHEQLNKYLTEQLNLVSLNRGKLGANKIPLNIIAEVESEHKLFINNLIKRFTELPPKAITPEVLTAVQSFFNKLQIVKNLGSPQKKLEQEIIPQYIDMAEKVRTLVGNPFELTGPNKVLIEDILIVPTSGTASSSGASTTKPIEKPKRALEIPKEVLEKALQESFSKIGADGNREGILPTDLWRGPDVSTDDLQKLEEILKTETSLSRTTSTAFNKEASNLAEFKGIASAEDSVKLIPDLVNYFYLRAAILVLQARKAQVEDDNKKQSRDETEIKAQKAANEKTFVRTQEDSIKRLISHYEEMLNQLAEKKQRNNEALSRLDGVLGNDVNILVSISGKLPASLSALASLVVDNSKLPPVSSSSGGGSAVASSSNSNATKSSLPPSPAHTFRANAAKKAGYTEEQAQQIATKMNDEGLGMTEAARALGIPDPIK